MQDRPSETRLLLGRWHGGDRSALDALLERDLPWIRQHVRRRLGANLRARMDSADVVQEAMVEFLRHAPPFQSRPWVTTEAGRTEKVGTELDCPFCDMPAFMRDGEPGSTP